jgi:hypothetical protein
VTPLFANISKKNAHLLSEDGHRLGAGHFKNLIQWGDSSGAGPSGLAIPHALKAASISSWVGRSP